MQNTQKHTPGPWMLNLGNLCEIDTKSHAIAHIYGTASCETHVASECRANARLIAAAPELFAALKLAKQALESCEDDMKGKIGCTDWGNPQENDFPLVECDMAIAAARAAIAKATGQA